MEWMLMPLKRYAEFEGRSRRLEFWMFRLFFYIVMMVLLVIMLAGIPWGEFENEPGAPTPEMGVLFWLGLIGMILWYLACIVPSVAVCMRRFHDQDKSGWMWLIYFVPYVGWMVVVVFMFLEGTRGPNQYGEDPKDPGAQNVFA